MEVGCSAAGRTARADVAEREESVFGTSQWEPRERSAPFSQLSGEEQDFGIC